MKMNFMFFHKLWHGITAEVTVFIFFLLYEILTFLETNLLLRKSCYFNLTSEPDLSIPCDDETTAQKYVAELNSWRLLSAFFVSIIFTILAAIWTSNHGKESRPLIYFPAIGQAVLCIFGALNSYFWSWSPLFEASGSTIILGFSGSKICMVLGSQLYIASITSVKDRTYRLGLLNALHYLTLPIGNGVAGLMNTYLGFARSYLVCFLLAITGIVTGYYKVRDPSVEYEKTMTFLQSISPITIFKSVAVVFKKRPGYRRIVLIMLLVMDPLHLTAVVGEQTVMYLYLRYRFGWQENEYSLYTAYKMLGTLSGTLFCTIYLSKYLKIHDGIIGTIAGFWDTVGNISYFYADQTWQLYVIPLYNIFNGVLFAMMASLSTKCVEHNEMGYLTSVRSLMQIVTPLSFPLYGLVYKATIDFLPHAFFLLSMAFNFPTIILFAIAYYLSKDMKFDDSNPVESNNEQPPLKEIKQSS